MFEARKLLVLETCKHNKISLLLQILECPEEIVVQAFTLAEITLDATKEQRYKRLSRLLNKHKELIKKYNRRVKTLDKKDDEEDDDKGFTTDDFNQAIASFESLGYTIEDYNTITLGKFEAISKIEKQRKDGRGTDNRPAVNS